MSDRRLSVFLPFDNQDGYIAVIIKERDLIDMRLMGWYETADEAIQSTMTNPSADVKYDSRNDDNVSHETTDGDKGDGCRPGDIEWHKKALDEKESKHEIQSYVENVTGIKINIRGRVSIVDVKEKALQVLEGYNDG